MVDRLRSTVDPCFKNEILFFQTFQVSNAFWYLGDDMIAFVFNKEVFDTNFICFAKNSGDIQFSFTQRNVILRTGKSGEMKSKS